jgi:GNAT superfamily N-acetyltransferase
MIRIRAARPEDVGLIHRLIRGLAEYEKLLHEVKITEAEIAEALFGAAPRVFCDLADADVTPVGYALWFYNFSTFEGGHGLFLEDIYVVPEARGTGAGMALMRGLARRCRDEGLRRLEWHVLDWNALAIDFYDRLGAGAEPEWVLRRLSGDALTRLAEEARS